MPGINEFLAQYTKMWAPEGPLTKRGMIASSDADRAKASDVIAQGVTMKRDGLH